MRRWLGVVVLLCVVPIGAGAQGALYPPKSDGLVRAARVRSNQAIATRDLKAFGETLGENLTVTTGRGTFLTSKEAYLQSFAEDFADPAAAVTYVRTTEAVELSASLPEAAERGHWKGVMPDGTVVYTGTYMAMWRYTAEGWKLRSELYVTLSCAPKVSCFATMP